MIKYKNPTVKKTIGCSINQEHWLQSTSKLIFSLTPQWRKITTTLVWVRWKALIFHSFFCVCVTALIFKQLYFLYKRNLSWRFFFYKRTISTFLHVQQTSSTNTGFHKISKQKLCLLTVQDGAPTQNFKIREIRR